MKKSMIIVIAVIVLIGIAAMAPAAPVKLRVNVQQVVEHETAKAMERIKERVEKETEGGLTLDVYYGSVLGDYTVMFEETMLGTVDMSLQSLPGQYDPKLEMTFIPYLFTGYDSAAKVFSPGSNTYAIYERIVAGHGMKALGIFAEGFVCVGTTKLDPNYADPTAKKEQLLRVPAIETNRMIIAAMNYPTVTINYSDLYPAMQTGVCDGWFGGTSENNYLSFRDVIKYFINYNALMENNVMLMSAKSWEKLPEDYQKILYNACIDESIASYGRSQQTDEKYISLLASDGVEIVRLSDEQIGVIADHVREVTWPTVEKQLGKEIMDAVRADLAK